MIEYIKVNKCYLFDLYTVMRTKSVLIILVVEFFYNKSVEN